MSVTFTKLFSSITESTIWCEPSDTRIVWITMLAMADRKGRVFGSIPGLANRAQVSVDSTRAAVKAFMDPDPDSRTPDHEGRRIMPIDGGWLLLNHAKYRAIRDEEERRNYKTEKQREYRQPVDNVDNSGHPKTTVDHGGPAKTGVDSCGHNAEADSEADISEDKSSSPPAGESPGRRKDQRLRMTDAEWLASLKANPLFARLNIDEQVAKARLWCETNNRQCTRKFFVNWLNRALDSAPMAVNGSSPHRNGHEANKTKNSPHGKPQEERDYNQEF